MSQPRTPQNQTERLEQRQAVLNFLLQSSNGSTTPRTHPDPAKLQTPYLGGCPGTGMQRFEWTLLNYHIEQNPRVIAGFWPNIEVGDFSEVTKALEMDIEPKYIQPWIPRLDAVLVTYNGQFVAVEIADSITPKLIGEACVKYSMFKRLHPTAPAFESIHIVHIVGNNFVSSLAIRSLPDFYGIPIFIFRYDIKDLRLEPDDPKLKLYERF